MEKPSLDKDAASSFDISLINDLTEFITVILVKQQHLNIFKIIDSKIYGREFAYNYSKQYIS